MHGQGMYGYARTLAPARDDAGRMIDSEGRLMLSQFVPGSSVAAVRPGARTLAPVRQGRTVSPKRKAVERRKPATVGTVFRAMLLGPTKIAGAVWNFFSGDRSTALSGVPMYGYGVAVDSGPSEQRIQLYRLDQRIKDAIKRKDFATAERLQRQRDAYLRASQGRTLKPKTQSRTVYPKAPTTLADLVASLKAAYTQATAPVAAPAAPAADTMFAPSGAAAPAVPSSEAAEVADEGIASAEGLMGRWNDLSTTGKVAVGAGALGLGYFLLRKVL